MPEKSAYRYSFSCPAYVCGDEEPFAPTTLTRDEAGKLDGFRFDELLVSDYLEDWGASEKLAAMSGGAYQLDWEDSGQFRLSIELASDIALTVEEIAELRRQIATDLESVGGRQLYRALLDSTGRYVKFNPDMLERCQARYQR